MRCRRSLFPVRLDVLREGVDLANRVELARQIAVDIIDIDIELAVNVEVALLLAARQVTDCHELLAELQELAARRVHIELDLRDTVFLEYLVHRHAL